MKEVTVYHYDAFTNVPHKGNPAGIVVEEAQLTEDEMQRIAAKVGFNETAFALPSERDHLRIRYFTPGHEMNLCGHGTIATLRCLQDLGMLKAEKAFTIETKAGSLQMEMMTTQEVLMQQAAPEFIPYEGSLEALAQVIGITPEEIDSHLPIVYGSTGTWTLLVPIKRLETFKRMKPLTQEFPSVLQRMPRTSIHPICLETYDPESYMHARHFSSAYSGTVEDPVTGTASGVMGAYVLNYIEPHLQAIDFIVEQGHEMGREGLVQVYVDRKGEEMKVAISGTAVQVHKMIITLS